MKIVIIEDEKPAAEKLQQLVNSIDPSLIVEAVLMSVEASIKWFEKQDMPDLLLMDIALSDGLSFTLLEKCRITCPVIFTTAYDEYWQEAFEHNSIDYLLKPIRKEKLAAAVKKYHVLREHFTLNLQPLLLAGAGERTAFKKRFLVKRGTDLSSVKANDIAYFYATHKLVCLVTFTEQKYILDRSLADIERETDPAQFYRVNRKFLVNVDAIKKMKTQKGKLQLELQPVVNEEITISQENAGLFKDWLCR
jgi:two-component system LytT family response regulator